MSVHIFSMRIKVIYITTKSGNGVLCPYTKWLALSTQSTHPAFSLRTSLTPPPWRKLAAARTDANRSAFPLQRAFFITITALTVANTQKENNARTLCTCEVSGNRCARDALCGLRFRITVAWFCELARMHAETGATRVPSKYWKGGVWCWFLCWGASFCGWVFQSVFRFLFLGCSVVLVEKFRSF